MMGSRFATVVAASLALVGGFTTPASAANQTAAEPGQAGAAPLVQQQPGPYWRIRLRAGGPNNCLVEVGGDVRLGACVGAQRWRLESAGAGRYLLRHQADGQCLNRVPTAPPGTDEVNDVACAPVNNNKRWDPTHVGPDGYHAISGQATGFCLVGAPPAQVRLTACAPINDNKRWKFFDPAP